MLPCSELTYLRRNSQWLVSTLWKWGLRVNEPPIHGGLPLRMRPLSSSPISQVGQFWRASFLGEKKTKPKKIRAKKTPTWSFPSKKCSCGCFLEVNFGMESRTSCLGWVKSKLSSPYRLANVFRRDSSSPKWSRPNLCFVMFDDFMFLCWVMFDGFCTKIQRVLKDAVDFGATQKTISTSLSFCLAVAVKSSNRHVVAMIRKSMKICFRKVCLLRRFP